MLPQDFSLILITPEKEVAGEAQLIAELFEAGLQLLHIRKPTYTIEETKKLLTAIPENLHPKIVIHSHYELLNDFSLKGAHLPEKIRKEGTTSEIKHIVSTSFHKTEDILSTKANFEYAFFSPVFQSMSKQDYEPTIGTNVLKDFLHSNKHQLKFPIIALGGITDQNVLQAQDMGFSGAACIGYIWENSNPVGQFKKLQKIVRS